MKVYDEPKEGRPAKIEDKGKEKITEFIDENNPKKHGVNASFWDCRELQKYFSQRGKIFHRKQSDCISRELVQDTSKHSCTLLRQTQKHRKNLWLDI